MSSTNLRPLVDALCETLVRLNNVQQALTLAVDEQRAALARGDTAAMDQQTRRQQEALRQAQTLNQLRQRTALKLTGYLAPEADQPLPLRGLAQRLGEPHRTRLLSLREQLHGDAEAGRRSLEVTQKAARSLAHHVGCVLQNLSHLQRGGAAYGTTGRPTQAAAGGALSLSLSA